MERLMAIGVLLSFLAGIIITTILLSPEYKNAEFNRCVNLYINNPELQRLDVQDELKAVMKAAGVSTLNGLVEQRCRYWLSTGNHF